MLSRTRRCVEYPNAPGMRDRLAGLQDQRVVADHEGVRRAGHGLDGRDGIRVAWVLRPGKTRVRSSAEGSERVVGA
jgi:hypothetical protein